VTLRESATALALRLMGLSLSIALSCSADAQGAHGDFGARSEAAIRISVSVAPRFKSNAFASAGDDGFHANAPAGFASNSPALRYSVRALPALPAKDGLATSVPSAGRSDADGDGSPLQRAERVRVLYLIVPD
jgi:hypothetical protein